MPLWLEVDIDKLLNILYLFKNALIFIVGLLKYFYFLIIMPLNFTRIPNNKSMTGILE